MGNRTRDTLDDFYHLKGVGLKRHLEFLGLKEYQIENILEYKLKEEEKTREKKITEITEICKRYNNGLCVKCGTDKDFIDKKELDHLKCAVCGFEYYPNWQKNYVEAIEEILKK